MTTTYRSRPGWKLGTFVLVILPPATLWIGNWVIWNVFEQGTYIAIGSTADHLLDAWRIDHFGPEVVGTTLAAGLLFAFRVRPRVTIPLSLLAGALTGASWFVLLVIALAMNPGALS